MLESFNSAVANDGEFYIYLYEILDALQKIFSKPSYARRKLGIGKSDWDVIGLNANKRAVSEGRHRGRYTDLHPSSPEEKKRAFDVAATIIKKYVEYRVSEYSNKIE